ncbi:MAG TPA: hypothetical protein GXX26_05180 [Clostridiaceae bacterium]|nr:hypothetical protein [Clostridiaceae bacterium]
MKRNGVFFKGDKLIHTKTAELPLGSVLPEGWLHEQLVLQSEGLTGHLDEFWDSVGPNSGWLGGTGENWERGPYYLDGLVPLAYLLNDEDLIMKALPWIEWTLESQTPDGDFGPRSNADWWPRMVMLKVLIQYHELTGDSRVIDFMLRYYGFVRKNIESKPLYSWGQARGGELIYCIQWLYDRTGSEWLLELSEIIHRQTLDWTGVFNDFPFTRPTGFYYNWHHMARSYNWDEINRLMQYHLTHIVNVTMGIKEPGLFYLQSGDETHRKAVLNGIRNLTRYHGQVNGMFSGDEHLSGTSPSQGHELCSVVEYLFSLQTLMDIYDENTLIPDLIEKVAFNALPATITKDFWGHQYLQQTNQVLVTKAKRNWFNNNDESNLFGLEPNYGCCTANMHQGWPKFLKTLWRATDDGGLAATVYAPCTVRAKVADNVDIIIEEITDYPFEEHIIFRIKSLGKKAVFPLRLRIPGWCEKAVVKINGNTESVSIGGTYHTITREWQQDDEIILELPMKIRLSFWHNNSVGIERGPLVYALKIKEQWKKLRENGPYGDWEVYPDSPWNYALELDAENPENSFMVIRNSLARQPFDCENSPIVLKAAGRRLPQWQIVDDSAGDVPLSPVVSNEPSEMIELIPYGAAKLRISQFPYIRTK